MSSLRMTIIMMVSYISCPFPAKAEVLLPCACTEALLPLKRPGEEGSASGGGLLKQSRGNDVHVLGSPPEAPPEAKLPM